jgi:hypothetical protein
MATPFEATWSHADMPPERGSPDGEVASRRFPDRYQTYLVELQGFAFSGPWYALRCATSPTPIISRRIIILTYRGTIQLPSFL